MIALILASLATQPPALTGTDVGQIVTTIVETVPPDRRGALGRVGSRPLLVDLHGSSAAFERFAGRALPVDTVAWLPGRSYTPATRTQGLRCEQYDKPVVAERCTVRGNAAWLHVSDVRAGDRPGQVVVRLHVLWTHTTRRAPRMSGYIRTVLLDKVTGSWQVVRELPTVVG